MKMDPSRVLDCLRDGFTLAPKLSNRGGYELRRRGHEGREVIITVPGPLVRRMMLDGALAWGGDGRRVVAVNVAQDVPRP